MFWTFFFSFGDASPFFLSRFSKELMERDRLSAGGVTVDVLAIPPPSFVVENLTAPLFSSSVLFLFVSFV